jgi:hypothetical protein
VHLPSCSGVWRLEFIVRTRLECRILAACRDSRDSGSIFVGLDDGMTASISSDGSIRPTRSTATS